MFKKFLINTRDGQYNFILLIVIIYVVLLRFLNINQMVHLSIPELNVLGKADQLSHDWLISGKEITSAIYLYGLAFATKIFGMNIVLLRCIQAFISLLTIGLFYFFTKDWFNRRVALIATLFLSINAFYLGLSRNIDPIILVPLFLIAIVYLYTLAFKTEKLWLFILSGVVSGLSLYTDKIFFVLPFVFALTFYYFYKKGERFITTFRVKILASLISFAFVSLPYIFFLSDTAGQLLKTYNPGSVGAFFLNLGNLLLTLLFQAPVNRLYNIGTQPLLDPFIAITFLAGLVYAVFHTDRRKYFFMIIAFVALIFIISFDKSDIPRNYLTLYPLIFIFSATIFNYVLKTWFETFPFNKVARFLFTFFLSVFVFLAVFYNYQKYFVAWSQNKEVKAEYSHDFEEIKK